MMAYKICFSGEIWIIIPKLSLLLLLIWSPDSGSVDQSVISLKSLLTGQLVKYFTTL